MNSCIALASLLATTSGLAFAQYQQRYEISYSADDDLIASTENSSPTAGSQVKTAPFFSARPDLSGGAGITVYGDFLYWKAAEEGLTYGLQSINPSNKGKFGQSNPFLGVSGKPSGIHPGWEPGYRLGAAYNIPHDQWDISFTWTRYTSQKRDFIAEKPQQVVFTYWLDLNFYPLSSAAKAKWDLSFNVIDLDLSRAFYLGKHFSITPFAGFKAAWINQQLHIDYQNVTYVSTVTAPFIKSNNRNNFQGYGIGAGMDGKWDLWKGFHLFGKFEGGLLLGEFKIAEFQHQPGIPRTHLSDKVHEVAPMLGMQGGLGWQTQMHSNRIFLNIHVAWEEQLWFDQNQLSRFIEAFNEGMVKSQRGDLSFSGWTIGAMLGF